MQIAQPGVLILVEAANRTVGLLIAGLLIAVIYGGPGDTGRVRQASLG